ncbi:hypothetical protein AWM68_03175 [Fictibacillus phosphorivorans]|uniref:Lipoprotein n=1 Tax=Fictibacillus phosphorivorans TaxID=1221500 RepID=A0A161TJ80_9BACL|nr:hypothetical protein [Fictibacillus phosphorivorans]KZE69284.1 hypothetical protein AWM68_03175 [Fictibacillus phosphorivorans]
MKRCTEVLLWLMVILLAGCAEGNSTGMTGKKPPVAYVSIGDEKYETKLGSYCWETISSAICADTAGPIDLVQGEKPIEVMPGEEIFVEISLDRKPNEIHVSQFNNNQETTLKINKNHFKAPLEKGTYIYGYSVWWMSETEKDVSDGDALYAFALEVK